MLAALLLLGAVKVDSANSLSDLEASGLVFGVEGFGLGVRGFGLRVRGFGLGVRGFEGFGVLDLGLRPRVLQQGFYKGSGSG